MLESVAIASNGNPMEWTTQTWANGYFWRNDTRKIYNFGHTCVLPLHFISFTGEQQNKNVNLQWQTSDDINIVQFTVQRSTDGINFINIGVVKAKQPNSNNNYTQTELSRFQQFYQGRISRDQYSLLDRQSPGNFTKIVNEAVQIASLLAVGNSVFIIMAFRDESEDTFSTIKQVCKERELKWDRTDKDLTTDRVYQRIVSGIQRATFVIADVTIPTLNIYYELGFAEALSKPVIVIAKEGTDLPFDTQDIPTTLYRNQTRLREALLERIDGLAGVKSKV
jgi:hypothetical protein